MIYRPEQVQRVIADICENLSVEEQMAVLTRLQDWIKSTNAAVCWVAPTVEKLEIRSPRTFLEDARRA